MRDLDTDGNGLRETGRLFEKSAIINTKLEAYTPE